MSAVNAPTTPIQLRAACEPVNTEALFQDQAVQGFRAIERVGRRKLVYLHAARRLEELRVPPGNRLGRVRATELVSLAFGSDD